MEVEAMLKFVLREEFFGNVLLLLLLLLPLLSQSLLLFFLYISRAQTMHLKHQSLKSIILFIH